MKLFEDMKELGGTINDVIQKMINDMFREELDDDAVTEIVNKLSLSDLLALDDAYSSGDKERVQDILGPMPQMEYSMGAGRQASSSASSRPAPAQQGGSAAAKKPGTQNTTQTNRNYSDGVKNGVTTQNTDDENNLDAVMQDEEPIEEDSNGFIHDSLENLMNKLNKWENLHPYAPMQKVAPQMIANIKDEIANHPDSHNDFDVPQMEVTENTESFNSDEVIRTLLQIADDEHLVSLERLATRINQSFPDSVTLADIMNMLNEPQLRAVRRDDVEYALHAGGFLDMMEAKGKQTDETNIVEMTAWLKRRAGIN